jgi:osmoprotectant transport system permease protein
MSKQTIRAFAWSGVVAVALAGLVAWIGVDVINQYQERLLYDVVDHLRLVAISMALALATGIPAGID